MELDVREQTVLESYLTHFDPLLGDRRSRWTFRQTVQGIVAAESLRVARIAAFSPWAGGGAVWGEAGATDAEG